MHLCLYELIWKFRDWGWNLRVWIYHRLGLIHPQDVWNIDMSIARYSIRLLDRWFKDGVHGYPASHESYEAWMSDLKKIRAALAAVAREYDREPLMGETDWKQVQEGLDLFGKYFTALWD